MYMYYNMYYGVCLLYTDTKWEVCSAGWATAAQDDWGTEDGWGEGNTLTCSWSQSIWVSPHPEIPGADVGFSEGTVPILVSVQSGCSPYLGQPPRITGAAETDSQWKIEGLAWTTRCWESMQWGQPWHCSRQTETSILSRGKTKVPYQRKPVPIHGTWHKLSIIHQWRLIHHYAWRLRFSAGSRMMEVGVLCRPP